MLLLMTLGIPSISYATDSPLLKHVEALSRDYFYLDFSRDNARYHHQSIVGGEHITHYLVLGFSGDRFKIELQSKNGDIGYLSRDDGYIVEERSWDENKQLSTLIVKVVAQDVWVDVSVSAHPFADYAIEVIKLEKLTESDSEIELK